MLAGEKERLTDGYEVRIGAKNPHATIAEAQSQFDFADEIGISKTVLSDIECGRGNPTLDTLEHLADGLGVPLAALLGSADDAGTLQTARMLLSSIETLQELEPGYQTLAVRMFGQLILLLRPDAPQALEQPGSHADLFK